MNEHEKVAIISAAKKLFRSGKIDDIADIPEKMRKKQWKGLKNPKKKEELQTFKSKLEADEFKKLKEESGTNIAPGKVKEQAGENVQGQLDDWVKKETESQIKSKKRSNMKNLLAGTVVLGAPVMGYKAVKGKQPQPGSYSGGPVLNRSRGARY